MEYQWMLFDLDGTLLRTDKTISARTLEALEQSRQQGWKIGVITSRAQQNCEGFLSALRPDALISSAGALIRLEESYIYKGEFSGEETWQVIQKAREIAGDLEITVDTLEEHFWNYHTDPLTWDATWGSTTYDDFIFWDQPSLKICLELFDEDQARRVAESFPDADMIKFSESSWYKLTKKEATKESAIDRLCTAAGISREQIIAFGDDLPDINMLKSCGCGVAMGNAIPEVRAAADLVIGTNDEDGIAVFIEELLDKQSRPDPNGKS